MRFGFSNSLLSVKRQFGTGDTITVHIRIILIDFSLNIKAATLIFIFGRGSAISSAKQGKSGSI